MTIDRKIPAVSELSLEGLNKIHLNSFKAVNELSVDTTDGEFLVLVEPSGCGKLTQPRKYTTAPTVKTLNSPLSDNSTSGVL
jgi:ABC-type uncharacterized transport system ATPase subunit